MAGKARPRPCGTDGTEENACARQQAAFLEALTLTASVSESCKKAKIGRTTAYRWRKEVEKFAEAWDEALTIGADVLEDEAVRRAVKGVDKPVYQGGELVGKVREYSDTLLIFLLKGTKPEKFKDRGEITGKDGAPLNVNVYLPAKGGQGEATAVEGPAEPEEPAEPEPPAAQAEPKKSGRKRSNS